jgi:hypothetical protein
VGGERGGGDIEAAASGGGDTVTAAICSCSASSSSPVPAAFKGVLVDGMVFDDRVKRLTVGVNVKASATNDDDGDVDDDSKDTTKQHQTKRTKARLFHLLLNVVTVVDCRRDRCTP